MVAVACVPLPDPPLVVYKIRCTSDSLRLTLTSSGRHIREIPTTRQNSAASNVPIETARVALVHRVVPRNGMRPVFQFSERQGSFRLRPLQVKHLNIHFRHFHVNASREV